MHDGSGVIISPGGTTVLVTCKHVLNEDYVKHFFVFCGNEYTIDTSSRNYFKSPHPGLPEAKNGEEVILMDDYAFFRFDCRCNANLKLGISGDVEMNDEIILITHDTNGKQIRLSGVRRNDKDYALHGWNDGKYYKGFNTMSIDIEGVKRGYSGGAIIHSATGKCVGILKGGERDLERFDFKCPYMIRAETIRPRFRALQTTNS